MAEALALNSDSLIPRRRWSLWIYFLAFLLVSVESILIAIVFKGTLLVLVAPGAVCWLKAMELWKQLRSQLKLS